MTVKREFMEEALDSTGANKDNVEELREMIGGFFDRGEEVYSGYVDDPRNTDNSWMETVAFNFHDETGTVSVQGVPYYNVSNTRNQSWSVSTEGW